MIIIISLGGCFALLFSLFFMEWFTQSIFTIFTVIFYVVLSLTCFLMLHVIFNKPNSKLKRFFAWFSLIFSIILMICFTTREDLNDFYKKHSPGKIIVNIENPYNKTIDAVNVRYDDSQEWVMVWPTVSNYDKNTKNISIGKKGVDKFSLQIVSDGKPIEFSRGYIYPNGNKRIDFLFYEQKILLETPTAKIGE